MSEEQQGGLPEGAPVPETRRRDKSTVAFPYSNLEEVASLAKAIYDRGGVPMTRDQIADVIGTAPENSTLRVKLAAAQTFGALYADDGKLSLTEIGRGLASGDEGEAAKARVEAFLSVELYRKLVDHFRNQRLPPAKGIEAVIKALGVAEKQCERARWAFEKSAAFAGYFNATKDRLVAPVLTAPAQKEAALQNGGGGHPPKSPPPEAPKKAEFDPLIEGMLRRLPPANQKWPMQQRVRWLRTLAANFSEVYDADDLGDIVVKFEPDTEI
jgi:hypothetical protein